MQFKKIINKDGENKIKKYEIKDLIANCKDEEVILKVLYSAVCGSDLSNFKKTHIGEPKVMGHEYSGSLFYCGKNVPGSFRGGTTIYNVQPNVHCNKCTNCINKNFSLCNEKKCYGYHYEGGYSEYTKVHYKNLYVYENKSTENAICSSLIEPVACIIKTIKKANIQISNSVLITGAGFTGLSMILYLNKELKLKQITSVDIKKINRKKSLELGANKTYDSVPEDTFDIVIDTTGNTLVINKALKSLNPSGKLVIFGVANEKSNISLNAHDVWKKEITILGSRSTNHNHDDAIDFVKRYNEIFVKMITHRLRLESLENIETIVSQKNYIKGVICREKSL